MRGLQATGYGLLVLYDVAARSCGPLPVVCSPGVIALTQHEVLLRRIQNYGCDSGSEMVTAVPCPTVD